MNSKILKLGQNINLEWEQHIMNITIAMNDQIDSIWPLAIYTNNNHFNYIVIQNSINKADIISQLMPINLPWIIIL